MAAMMRPANACCHDKFTAAVDCVQGCARAAAALSGLGLERQCVEWPKTQRPRSASAIHSTPGIARNLADVFLPHGTHTHAYTWHVSEDT